MRVRRVGFVMIGWSEFGIVFLISLSMERKKEKEFYKTVLIKSIAK